VRGAQALDDIAECSHHALISLSQKRGENVLADPLAPQVIAAVAARVKRRVEIDPMILGATGKMIPAFANAIGLERQTALEASDINAACHFEIDCWFHFFAAPVHSYKFAV
jgi:hypothetical protein